MPRRSVASDNVLARIRSWFGLRRADLALYLEISPSLVQGVENRQRRLTSLVAQGMLPLAGQLPQPIELIHAPLPEALPPGTVAPDASELDFRRCVCLQRAAKLRAQAEQLARRAHYAQRWATALPALLPLADAPGLDADRATWLRGWLQRRARPLPVEDVTRWHLLRTQAQANETEAAALAALIGSGKD